MQSSNRSSSWSHLVLILAALPAAIAPAAPVITQSPYSPVPSAESLKVLDSYFAWRWTPEGEAWAK